MSDPHKPDHHDLDDFMSGKSDVSRAYRAGPAPSAPPELDVGILDLARAQVQKRLPVRPSFARRARVPLALAATVILGFGTINLMREDKAAREQAMLPPPPPAAPVSAPMVIDETEVSAMSDHASPLKKEPAPAPAVEGRQRHDAPAQKPAAKDEGVTAQPATEAAPAPAPAASMGRVAPIIREQKLAAPDRSSEPAAAAEFDRRDNTAAKAKMSRPEMMNAPARAPAEAPSFDALGAAQPTAPEPAADWLSRIRKLRDQSNLPAAREQLEAFKKTYPNYPLPEDLKKLSEPASTSKP